MGLRTTFALVCFCLSMCCYAELVCFPDSTRKAKRDSLKKWKIDEGKPIITPVGAPAYTPELGFLVAGGVLSSFRFSKSDTNLKRSTLPATIGISSTGAVVIQARLTSFLLDDKLRINSELWYKHMPDHYWGVGYNSVQQVDKGDSTQYLRTWFLFNPEFYWQFKKSMFLGAAFDINKTLASAISPFLLQDAAIRKFGRENFNAGAGLVFMFDNRDVPVNAYQGWFFQLKGLYYGSYLGSQNEYGVYQLDVRNYQQLFGEGKTLALQFKSRLTSGNVPYGELSMVGSPFDLRGYFWGMYRDKQAMYGLAEYRHRFNKLGKKELSKVGMVLWTGVGSVSPSIQEFKYWLPNAGIGLRFELQPRLNLRLDYGVGYNSTGFYFNFNEAF